MNCFISLSFNCCAPTGNANPESFTPFAEMARRRADNERNCQSRHLRIPFVVSTLLAWTETGSESKKRLKGYLGSWCICMQALLILSCKLTLVKVVKWFSQYFRKINKQKNPSLIKTAKAQSYTWKNINLKGLYTQRDVKNVVEFNTKIFTWNETWLCEHATKTIT